MAQGLKFPHKKVLFKADRGKFRDGSTMCWDNFPIPVPNVPPSGLPHCNIIDIEYEIKVAHSFSRLYWSVKNTFCLRRAAYRWSRFAVIQSRRQSWRPHRHGPDPAHRAGSVRWRPRASFVVRSIPCRLFGIRGKSRRPRQSSSHARSHGQFIHRSVILRPT